MQDTDKLEIKKNNSKVKEPIIKKIGKGKCSEKQANKGLIKYDSRAKKKKVMMKTDINVNLIKIYSTKFNC